MSSTRHEFDSLFLFYVAIAGVVMVAVFGAVAFAVWRYRYREGEDRKPLARHEARRLELVYALVVAAVIAVVLTRTLSTESTVDATAPRSADTVAIDVLAFQWGWRFTYSSDAVSVVGDDLDPPVLTVPLNRRVSFTLRARDVIHAFWLPNERFKRDAIPGRVNRFDLIFEDAGTKPGLCAEFCGLRHADMRFFVRALPQDEFDAWLVAQREKRGDAPNGANVEPAAGDET